MATTITLSDLEFMREFEKVVADFAFHFDVLERCIADGDPNSSSNAEVQLLHFRQRFNNMVRHAEKLSRDCGIGPVGYDNLLKAKAVDVDQFESGLPAALRTGLNDYITQTISGCERRLEEKQSPVKAAATGLASFFSSVFKTETDRAILKWAIIVLIVVTILRMCGLPLEKVGELVSSWLKK